MTEGSSSENVIKQLKLDANLAAGTDARQKVSEMQAASKKIIDRMAHHYEFSRPAVDYLNAKIKQKLDAFEPQSGILNLMEQIHVAAVEGFNEAFDEMLRRGHHKEAMHVYERWRREYEDELHTFAK